MPVVGEISTGINSIIGSMSSIAENTVGLDSITDSMNSIADNITGINSIIENTKGIDSIIDYMNSSIENTRSENILGYMYPSIDEIGGGLYKTFDSINDINANAKGIYNYHFIKIEEQLDQIINNTARNGYSTLSTISDFLNIALVLYGFKDIKDGIGKIIKKDENSGGKGGGLGDVVNRLLDPKHMIPIGIGLKFSKDEKGWFDSVIDWFNDPENVPSHPGNIGDIYIPTEYRKEREVTGTNILEDVKGSYSSITEDLNIGFSWLVDDFNHSWSKITNSVEATGSWFKDKGFAPIEYYKNVKARQPKSPEGESPSVLVGDLGTGNNFKDYFTIDQGSQFFDDLKGIGSKSSEIWEAYLDKYFREDKTPGIPYSEGGSVIVGGNLNGENQDKGVDWSTVGEASAMVAGAFLVKMAIDEIRQLIQYVPQYVPRLLGAKNTIPESESITGYQEFASAKALGNGNIYSNSQNDLRDDNIKNNYNEIATQNNNSNVSNNPTNNYNFKIEVKEKVNLKNFLRDFETEMASVMDYSGMRTT